LDPTLIIVASITAIPATIAAYGSYRNGRKTDAVKEHITQVGKVAESIRTEVKTINDQTLANLADAGETRRIRALQPEDRTALDEAHLRSVDEGKGL